MSLLNINVYSCAYILHEINGKKTNGYYYIIIGILLLLFSLNRMYRNRNK